MKLIKKMIKILNKFKLKEKNNNNKSIDYILMSN